MKFMYLLSAALITAGPAIAQEVAPAPAPETVTSEAAPSAPASSEASTVQETSPSPVVTAAAAPVADEPKCELHIWPAERFQAMTTGWLGGGLLDAAIHADGDKARRSQMASALDPGGQLDALQKLDLIALLKLPASKIVTHEEALDRKTVNKILTRRSDSKASCYSELIVTDVLYTKAAMWGRSLRTSFILRQFDASTGAPRIKKTTGGNGLKIFPAKKGEDTTEADAELVSIFQKNFTEATENFAKQTGSTS
ncbi:hypothetical protein GCM10023264_03580 [Sphingomonas daechungensis]|uniref:Uncharacterized protein n=1 Tax=Sphingomonas daechungensis TaxID=1176646 RepID=A0ABX6SZR5_9SPHN|nr:hypothetical protein [Sphingomonas daechungensis]QNP42781.1 hypothetical protein H9L15_11845 [Sphingomonas daechungensis]